MVYEPTSTYDIFRISDTQNLNNDPRTVFQPTTARASHCAIVRKRRWARCSGSTRLDILQISVEEVRKEVFFPAALARRRAMD